MNNTIMVNNVKINFVKGKTGAGKTKYMIKEANILSSNNQVLFVTFGGLDRKDLEKIENLKENIFFYSFSENFNFENFKKELYGLLDNNYFDFIFIDDLYCFSYPFEKNLNEKELKINSFLIDLSINTGSTIYASKQEVISY